MHLEALTEKGKELFPALSRFDGFYLAGGTCLALQIGHRVSIDFDLFSGQEIPQGMLARVRNAFPESVIFPSVNNTEELTVMVDSVKVTFLYYPFPLVDALVGVKSLQVASVKEIAAMKAYTIGRRAVLKDYVDIYAVLAGEYSTLPDIIALARKKYAEEFNDRLFLEQLVSLEDVEDEEITFLHEPIGKDVIEQYLEEQVGKIDLSGL